MRIGGDVERFEKLHIVRYYIITYHLAVKRRTGLGRLRVDLTTEQTYT